MFVFILYFLVEILPEYFSKYEIISYHNTKVFSVFIQDYLIMYSTFINKISETMYYNNKFKTII